MIVVVAVVVAGLSSFPGRLVVGRKKERRREALKYFSGVIHIEQLQRSEHTVTDTGLAVPSICGSLNVNNVDACQTHQVSFGNIDANKSHARP